MEVRSNFSIIFIPFFFVCFLSFHAQNDPNDSYNDCNTTKSKKRRLTGVFTPLYPWRSR